MVEEGLEQKEEHRENPHGPGDQGERPPIQDQRPHHHEETTIHHRAGVVED
jgi:hypothetical protein